MREWIEPGYSEIPIYRPCELLGLSRSGYDYRPQAESPLNLRRMNLIDEQYTKMPFYGVEKMTEWLRRQGFPVNPKRVRRLMRLMGLEAIYPKRRLQPSIGGVQKIPLSFKGFSDRAAGAGLVRGHHRYPDAAGFSLSRGHHGRVQSVCAGLGTLQLAGSSVLSGRTGAGADPLAAGDLQQRSGVLSLQASSLPEGLRPRESGSARTVGDGSSTTSLSSVCGGR